MSIVLLCLLTGCKPVGPASAHTNSSQLPTRAERIAFLNQYLKFRWSYESLDFDITYQNNGGSLPGPSDWDIRFVAVVPNSELQAWIPASVQSAPSSADILWLKTVPTALDLSGVAEWYLDLHRIVGIDRAKRLVVYRAWSY